jgi:hypothetical protein
LVQSKPGVLKKEVDSLSAIGASERGALPSAAASLTPLFSFSGVHFPASTPSPGLLTCALWQNTVLEDHLTLSQSRCQASNLRTWCVLASLEWIVTFVSCRSSHITEKDRCYKSGILCFWFLPPWLASQDTWGTLTICSTDETSIQSAGHKDLKKRQSTFKKKLTSKPKK